MGWWVYLYKELDLSIKGKVEFYALWSSFAPRFVFHIISLSLVSCNGCKRIDLRQHMCKTWNDTTSPQCWFGLHPIHLHKELIFIMFGISQQYWFRLRDVCLGLFRGQFKAHHSFPDFQSSILRLTNEKYSEYSQYSQDSQVDQQWEVLSVQRHVFWCDWYRIPTLEGEGGLLTIFETNQANCKRIGPFHKAGIVSGVFKSHQNLQEFEFDENPSKFPFLGLLLTNSWVATCS